MADLFEEYKEALKKGHVAVLRGELGAAIGHYRAAAAIAPDRPLPHSSLGGVLLRLGRTAEAVAAYGDAVLRGPTDETALGGLSDALLAGGRRAEAAELLDRLARVQLEKGRQPEALATRGLARAVRAAGGIPEPDSSSDIDAIASATGVPAQGAAAAGPSEAPRPQADAAGEPAGVIELPAPSDAGGAQSETGAPAAEAAVEREVAPPSPPTPAELLGAAEQATADGRTDDAVRDYVRAAGAYREQAAIDAGLDACQQALSLEPGSPDVHLAMAGLYFDRGWQERAAEKLVLLDRLLELQEPNGWREELLSLASEHRDDDPRLAALTARHAAQQTAASGE